MRELPKVGLLFLITISPPNGVSLTAILRAFCAALDAWDCDYYSALDRGKRNNKEHVHSIVFTRDPTSFIRRFGAWMEKHAINAAATDVQPVKGCSNYVIGRGDEQLTKDLMFMAGYPTKGGPARPPAQSRARGVFVRARRQLLRDTEHTVMTAANTGACDECGGPLPSGATQRRRFCRDACKLKSFRRRRHERTFWRITLRRKLPRR